MSHLPCQGFIGKDASKRSVGFCFDGRFVSRPCAAHSRREVIHAVWISFHDKRILITKSHRNVCVSSVMQGVYDRMIKVNPQPDCIAEVHALRDCNLAIIT